MATTSEAVLQRRSAQPFGLRRQRPSPASLLLDVSLPADTPSSSFLGDGRWRSQRRGREILGRTLTACCVLATLEVSAGTIETEFLQRPWPKETVRELEVGRYPVRWRQKASKTEGLFAGVRFVAPLRRELIWDLATDIADVSRVSPDVDSVYLLEDSANRQVIQVNLRVLWKILSLTFEIEKQAPEIVRFRLVNEVVGEYRGVCLFEEVKGTKRENSPEAHTAVELITWLKPSRPLPGWLVLFVERMIMLRGVEGFLKSCELRSTA